MKTVCKFCADVILARNNSGYIRSFIAYKAQKLLIISEDIFTNAILSESFLLSIILCIFAFKLKIFANERSKSYQSCAR